MHSSSEMVASAAICITKYTQDSPGHSRVILVAFGDRRGGSQLAEGDYCRQAGAQRRTKWVAAGQC